MFWSNIVAKINPKKYMAFSKLDNSIHELQVVPSKENNLRILCANAQVVMDRRGNS
uniref:Uncharacterized protein n=1 Tax=Arundo donax TaxID=35708 RepID=A0A0A9GTX3_ARUDO